ncbi:putative C6 transcription factor [Xylogone sp. PMI_703]|nr:putative C6 transcription factor [Xylogone sp. PMI_703]
MSNHPGEHSHYGINHQDQQSMLTPPDSGDTTSTQPQPHGRSRAPAPKVLSCVLCAQRKVKCDRKTPCSNCIKAGATCVPTIPNPPRRRKYRVLGGEEDLKLRLKRYEKLLLSFGMTMHELDSGVTAETRRPMTKVMDDLSIGGRVPDSKEEQLWGPLSEEILEGSSDDEFLEVIPDDLLTSADESSFLFPMLPLHIDLTMLHPPPVQIFQLWQAFVDNINPLCKIIHTPTVQQQILQASSNIYDLSKPMQALMFVIYAFAVTSMSEPDCEKMFPGEHRSSLLSKWRYAAQRALIAADVVKTTDMVVLQAFTLFILCVRANYDSQALLILSGVALRLAQVQGLHREALLARKTVFEAEIGRRLWWQLIVLESREAEMYRVSTLTDPRQWDTKLPANINDSDLYPDMREAPKDHNGTTEMIFCLLRYEVGHFLRTSPALNGSWQLFANQTIPYSQKEAVINSLESILQQKYLQYLDDVIPLHFLSLRVSRAFRNRLRLVSLHPRKNPSRSTPMSPHEKSTLFNLCLEIIQTDNEGHRTESIQKYVWHINAQFQADAFIYLVNELRGYPIGDSADRAWAQVLEAFNYRQELLTGGGMKNELVAAIGNLTLKAWSARESAYARMGQVPPEGTMPMPILSLKALRIKPGNETMEFPAGSFGHEILPQGSDTNVFPAEQMMSGDGGEVMDVNTNIDWAYWNELIQNYAEASATSHSEGQQRQR